MFVLSKVKSHIDIYVKRGNDVNMASIPHRLPSFTQQGLLPSGDYELSFDQVRNSHLVVGEQDHELYAGWDAAWRLKLVSNLELMVR